ncbi:hypothetical protein OS493_030598, partial [Desmophyllum pertusum]
CAAKILAAHNPIQHKEAVVKAFLHRKSLLPSKLELKITEEHPIMNDQRANGYPDKLLKKCLQMRTRDKRTQERSVNFAVLAESSESSTFERPSNHVEHRPYFQES